MRTKILFAILVSFILMPVPAIAQENEIFNSSGLQIPRFVTLRSDKVFVRSGPALRYPIKWVFVREGMPIEIIQEFDTWRKIRDMGGDEGWIHQSLLSGQRKAIITDKKGALMVKKPEAEARGVAFLEPYVILNLEECQGEWCFGEAKGFKGWLQRKSLWGVYQDEELD
jgi:SH3-like domain-containing protein